MKCMLRILGTIGLIAIYSQALTFQDARTKHGRRRRSLPPETTALSLAASPQSRTEQGSQNTTRSSSPAPEPLAQSLIMDVASSNPPVLEDDAPDDLLFNPQSQPSLSHQSLRKHSDASDKERTGSKTASSISSTPQTFSSYNSPEFDDEEDPRPPLVRASSNRSVGSRSDISEKEKKGLAQDLMRESSSQSLGSRSDTSGRANKRSGCATPTPTQSSGPVARTQPGMLKAIYNLATTWKSTSIHGLVEKQIDDKNFCDLNPTVNTRFQQIHSSFEELLAIAENRRSKDGIVRMVRLAEFAKNNSIHILPQQIQEILALIKKRREDDEASSIFFTNILIEQSKALLDTTTK